MNIIETAVSNLVDVVNSERSNNSAEKINVNDIDSQIFLVDKQEINDIIETQLFLIETFNDNKQHAKNGELKPDVLKKLKKQKNKILTYSSNKTILLYGYFINNNYLKEKLELEENETKFFMLCLGMLVILSMKKDINKYREAKLQPLLLAMINDYNDETGETCKKLLEKINEKLDLSFKFD